MPPLEGGPGMSDDERSVGLEQDHWGRMKGRGDFLQTVVAARDGEKLEGRYWELGTTDRLETIPSRISTT